MSSLACVATEVNESTGSAFLIAFQQHAAAMGFFRPIADRLQVKMKEVRYSVLQKGQTLVASILLGCPYTSSINHRLVPDPVVLAREWGKERFPDQSQINLFLNRLTAQNMAQLEQAHQELLRSHSLLRSAAQVIVDFDQTGLRVTEAGRGDKPARPVSHDRPHRTAARTYVGRPAQPGSRPPILVQGTAMRWEALGAGLFNPVAVSAGPHQLMLLARGSNNELMLREWSERAWGEPRSLGLPTARVGRSATTIPVDWPLAACSSGGPWPHMVARGTDGEILHLPGGQGGGQLLFEYVGAPAALAGRLAIPMAWAALRALAAPARSESTSSPPATAGASSTQFGMARSGASSNRSGRPR